MIDPRTIDTAKNWCRKGAQWVGQQAYTSGMRYLDQSIAVFQEADELGWLTYARHQKLEAARVKGGAEVQRLVDDVLRGYAALDDSYGKALSLGHHADWLLTNGQRDAAMAKLQLAISVANESGEQELLAQLQVKLADTLLEVDDCGEALRHYRDAESILQALGLTEDAASSRLSAAEVLNRLGMRSEAIALLEDVQTYFLRHQRYREALRALSPLVRLYEQAQLSEDRQRVTNLIHHCGQHIINQGAQGAPKQQSRRRHRIRSPQS